MRDERPSRLGEGRQGGREAHETGNWRAAGAGFFLASCFAELEGCLLGLRVELIAGLHGKGLGTSGVSGHVKGRGSRPKSRPGFFFLSFFFGKKSPR